MTVTRKRAPVSRTAGEANSAKPAQGAGSHLQSSGTTWAVFGGLERNGAFVGYFQYCLEERGFSKRGGALVLLAWSLSCLIAEPAKGPCRCARLRYTPDMDRAERAKQRREQSSRWPVRQFALGEEPLRDPLDRSSIDDRVRMMWPLAQEGWSLAGRPIPSYTRASMPGVLIRRER